jgi:hypothetical protein
VQQGSQERPAGGAEPRPGFTQLPLQHYGAQRRSPFCPGRPSRSRRKAARSPAEAVSNDTADHTCPRAQTGAEQPAHTASPDTGSPLPPDRMKFSAHARAAGVTSSSEEKLGSPVQHRMPASVALGLRSHPIDLATVVSRACRPADAVARHPPELRRCSELQRTRNLVITSLRLAGAHYRRPYHARCHPAPTDDHGVNRLCRAPFTPAADLRDRPRPAPGNWLAGDRTCSLAAESVCLAELVQLRISEPLPRAAGARTRGRRRTRRLQA